VKLRGEANAQSLLEGQVISISGKAWAMPFTSDLTREHSEEKIVITREGEVVETVEPTEQAGAIGHWGPVHSRSYEDVGREKPPAR
jgi:hypothetical protein